MPESTDKNWEELLQVFTRDIATNLTPIDGYARMLEAYLEQLVQQENVPLISFAPNQEKNITPEMALSMIRIIREHSNKLYLLKTAMRHEVGMGVGHTLIYMEERKKLINDPK